MVFPARFDDLLKEVVLLVLGGRNSDAAGLVESGKSELLFLVAIVSQPRWGGPAVVVLAWAGFVAELVGSQTASSLLLVSVGYVSKERMFSRVLSNADARRTIEEVRLFVIEEAPANPVTWLDRLEHVFRPVAPTTMQCQPFGGRTGFGKSSSFNLVPHSALVVGCQCTTSSAPCSQERIVCLLIGVTVRMLRLIVVLFLGFAAAGDPLQLPASQVTETSAQAGAYMERSWDYRFTSTFGSAVELRWQHRQASGDALLGTLSRLRVGNCLDTDFSVLNGMAELAPLRGQGAPHGGGRQLVYSVSPFSLDLGFL